MIDTEALDVLYDHALDGFQGTCSENELDNARQAVLQQLQRSIETPSVEQVANVGLPLLAAHAVLGAAIGSSAKVLRPAPGDVVVLWTPTRLADGDPMNEQSARERLVLLLRHVIENMGIENVTILALPDGMEIETLDPDAMGSIGWARA
jgi:hypothetical protein